ncbi:MAG: T9SS type A sorting domain-containing protein [Candidatus Babeliales bacterium]
MHSLFAQATYDTVSLGNGYANQAWYQLQSGNTTTVAKNTWDIAFATGGMSSTIWINSAADVELWRFPNGSTSDWASLTDTAGISTWQQLYNSEETWAVGAFSQTADPNDDFDLGWGTYSMVTHYVTGDSLYVIKAADGTYKKLWIDQLASGSYTFRFANLDGTNDVNTSLVKGDFAGKNFGYYSLVDEDEADLEPISDEWELFFGQYITFIPSPYLVTGVLANAGVEIAKAYPVANPDEISDFENFTFSEMINTIGWDWKSFNQTTFSFELQDSLAFFVKTRADSVWRIQFTGFEGTSSGGNFIFAKENLGPFEEEPADTNTVSIRDFSEKLPKIKTYPNPASGSNITLLLDGSDFSGNAVLSIHSLNGAMLHQEQIFVDGGFQQNNINISNLAAGAYVLQLGNESFRIQQKLIIQ